MEFGIVEAILCDVLIHIGTTGEPARAIGVQSQLFPELKKDKRYMVFSKTLADIPVEIVPNLQPPWQIA